MSAYANTLRISVFALFVFSIHAGNSKLSCYTCSSKTNEGCIRPDKSKIQQQICDSLTLNDTRNLARHVNEKFDKIFEVDIHHLHPQVPTNCLKQVTKVGTKEYVIRGCQLAASDGLDVCDRVKKENSNELHTEYCSLCGTNGCNTSSIATISVFLFNLSLFSMYLTHK